LTLDGDGTLSARGSATAAWKARAALLATTVPGVEHYTDDQVEDTDRRIERRLRESLQPPEGVHIEVRDGIAEVRGLAPQAWISKLKHPQPTLEGLAALQTDGLQPLEARRLSELVDRIEGSRIGFVTGIDLDAPQRAQVESLAGLLREAHQLALQLRQPIQLQIIGRTDGTGTPEQNLFIARERAERVAAALRASAYSLPPLQVLAIARPPQGAASDAELRRTEFRVIGVARPAAAVPVRP
jgi:outer membrane protein OmpA-like peptidoglycan-associated protein